MLNLSLQQKANLGLRCFTQVSLLAGLLLCQRVDALPEDSVQTAIRRIQQNSIANGSEFRTLQSYTGAVMEYRAVIPYGNSTVNISISPPEQSLANPSRLAESFWINNPPVGSNLSENSYNPRQDDIVLDLVSGIWGNEVMNDFVSSRFTDRVSEDFGTTHRTNYQGELYGYTIRYMDRGTEPRFAFIVQSLEEWDLRRRIRDEYGGD